MNYIELLGCNQIQNKSRVLIIVLKHTELKLPQAKNIIEKLFDNEFVKLYLDTNNEKCNQFVIELMELGVKIGNVSWHEES